jgi:hypothetical protein
MLNVKKYVLFSIPLCCMSYYSDAKVFSDQITFASPHCPEDYRLLKYYEAREHKQVLLSKMEDFSIYGLDDNWIIKGAGYHGLIEPGDPQENTVCYPNQPETDITPFDAKGIDSDESIEIQRRLVSNYDDFIRPVSYLAHFLGYAWVSGDQGDYIGQDMVVTKESDVWVLQGYQAPPCQGERCDEKTKITVSDFDYVLNSEKFFFDDVTESGRNLVKTMTAYIINDSDILKQINVEFQFEQGVNWSKYDDFDLGQYVQINRDFRWPQIGATKFDIILPKGQTYGETNQEQRQEQVSRQARLSVPPHSVLPIQIHFYHSDITYSYKIGFDISYKMNFNGFLRQNDNAWHSHPTNRPTKSHSFILGRASKNAENIQYQWDHRYIPGESKWWDWSWAISTRGLEPMLYATGATLRPFYSFITGRFEAKSRFSDFIEVGRERPIDEKWVESIPDNWLLSEVDGLIFGMDFDHISLERLGFENASVTLKSVN